MQTARERFALKQGHPRGCQGHEQEQDSGDNDAQEYPFHRVQQVRPGGVPVRRALRAHTNQQGVWPGASLLLLRGTRAVRCRIRPGWRFAVRIRFGVFSEVLARHWRHLSSFKGQPTRSYVRSPRSFVRRNVDNRLSELVSRALGSFCCALGLGPPNLTT